MNSATLQLSRESCTCTEGRCHADEEQDSTEQSLCRVEREMQGKQPNREESSTHSPAAASASRKPAEFGPRRKVEQPKCLAQRQSCSMTHSPTHTLPRCQIRNPKLFWLLQIWQSADALPILRIVDIGSTIRTKCIRRCQKGGWLPTLPTPQDFHLARLQTTSRCSAGGSFSPREDLVFRDKQM